jgi:hypothetical protein
MFLALLKSNWRPLAVLVLMVGCFFVGRVSVGTGTDKTTDKVTEQVATDVSEKDTTEKQADVVTTVTTKPDGTTVKTTVDHTKTTGQKSKTTDTKLVSKESKSESKPAAADPYRPNWSAGAGAWSGTDLKPYYEGSVGYRVLGNAWVQAGFNTHRELGAGLRIDF